MKPTESMKNYESENDEDEDAKPTESMRNDDDDDDEKLACAFDVSMRGVSLDQRVKCDHVQLVDTLYLFHEAPCPCHVSRDHTYVQRAVVHCNIHGAIRRLQVLEY